MQYTSQGNILVILDIERIGGNFLLNIGRSTVISTTIVHNQLV